jgi:hypothetical protein
MADAIPTQIVQNQTGFAPELAPYAQNLLGQAQAYTNVQNNPYMAYQGDMTAQFSPLQKQSYENAALMQTQPQLQAGTAGAGQAMLGALNTGYTYNPYQAQSFTSPGTSQAYMNPYIQNVMDVQSQAARRNAGMAGAQQQAQATQAGAFGGGRDAVMRAQGNANLQQNLANIQATGLNQAYNQGAQQFNTEQQATQAAANLNAQQGQFGAGLGLQGLNTALQGANTLGTLGNAQYNQNMGINQLQNQYGAQQQQQAQNVLNNQYQQFLNYQNYPYQQMNFMSNILRGLPMTQQGSQIYQAPPSMTSQVAGLAGAAVTGAKLLAAKGGSTQDIQKRGAGLADLAVARMGA